MDTDLLPLPIMVGNVEVLGAWLVLGSGSVFCIIGFNLFLKKVSFQYLVWTCCCALPGADFLAATSSSRSDDVTLLACLFACVCVTLFFYLCV